MKRIITLTLLLSLNVLLSFGQNVLSSTQMVSISPAIAPEIELSEYGKKMLNMKLTQIVTQNGFGAMGGNIYLTANVLVMDAQMTATAPVMMALECELSLALLNVEERVVLDEMSIPIKGIDSNKDKALMKCLNMINPRTPAVRAFMAECRKKVVDYYTTRIPALVSKANSLAEREQYAEAMAVLAPIPESLDEYPAIADMLVSMYIKRIDKEAKATILRAKADAANKNYEAAIESLLAINSSSTLYGEAETLIADIQSKVAEEERARIAAEIAEQRRKDELLRESQANDMEKYRLDAALEMARIENGVATAPAPAPAQGESSGVSAAQVVLSPMSAVNDVLNAWVKGLF